MSSYDDIVRADPRAAAGLLVPLGGVATDPNGVNYAVADIDGDQVVLRVWRDEHTPARTVYATKGVPVQVGDQDVQDVVVSAVLTEEGKRPWIVLGPA
jgi:hypothetical protein